jgi:hypothetical protein
MDGKSGVAKKVLVMALSGGSGPHGSNEAAQRRTWASGAGQDPHFLVLWMKGSAQTVQLDEDRNVLVPIPEIYENLLSKTILSMNVALANFDFDFVLRTNTSTYVNRALLLKHLETLPATSVYQGFEGQWRASTQGETVPFVSGSGILLSRDCASILASSDPSPWVQVPDDVAIAEIFRSRGVPILIGDRSSVTDFEPVRAHFNTRVKHWSDDSITVSRMERLHRLYCSRSTRQTTALLNEFDKRELRLARKASGPRQDKALRLAVRLALSRKRRLGGFVDLLESS